MRNLINSPKASIRALISLSLVAFVLFTSSHFAQFIVNYENGNGGDFYEESELYEINNYGANDNLIIRRDRHRNSVAGWIWKH